MVTIPAPQISRLLDAFTSIDDLLRRLNSNVEQLNRKLDRLLASLGETVGTIEQPPPPPPPPGPAGTIIVKPPAVAVKVPPPQIKAVISLPPGLDLVSAETITVNDREVTEYSIPKGSTTIMIESLDGDIWWSPKKFVSPDVGALYLAANHVLMISHPGWRKLYLRADSGQSRVVVAGFSVVQPPS